MKPYTDVCFRDEAADMFRPLGQWSLYLEEGSRPEVSLLGHGNGPLILASFHPGRQK